MTPPKSGEVEQQNTGFDSHGFLLYGLTVAVAEAWATMSSGSMRMGRNKPE